MNIYRVLGTAIAESVGAVGTAVRQLGDFPSSRITVAPVSDWADQFSDASLDDCRSRRTVDAMYRGAMVRI